MRLSGGEIIAHSLINSGVPWVAGIPGHGCLALVDAFLTVRDKLPLYLVRHEQSAAHMADGYFRVTGKPAAVFTSIGPGALNLAVGLGTAYVDSTAMLALIGETHTYMFGRGVLQEIERHRAANSLQALSPLARFSQLASRVEQLPHALNRSFSAMLSGRSGPAVIALPMDVQADSMNLDPSALAYHPSQHFCTPDPAAVTTAAQALAEAKRPVILAGGGVLRAQASATLIKLAERLGAAVITTMSGKSSFPEDHPLYGWHAGSKGTGCGNILARNADLIMAVGCRFADETASSYRQGASFNIPPTRLIHVDIDASEIGKNYTADIGLVGNAEHVMQALLEELGQPKKDMLKTPYVQEIVSTRQTWLKELAAFRSAAGHSLTVSKVLGEIRAALPRDAFLVTSSGHSQAQVLQEFPFYEPGTLITTGGFSTMGFSLPAALGVKLARPDQVVVALVGDGDFLMTAQELATAIQYNLNVIVIVLNNSGFLSIRDLQRSVYGEAHQYATEFTGRDGKLHSPDFTAMAQSYGLKAEKVVRPGGVQAALDKAIKANEPHLLEIMVSREYPYSGGNATGWWDVPVPEYLNTKRQKYEKERNGIDLSR
jgi:acetolactate synthase I/II/III large subunit